MFFRVFLHWLISDKFVYGVSGGQGARELDPAFKRWPEYWAGLYTMLAKSNADSTQVKQGDLSNLSYLATPPGTLHGSLTTKKLHLFSRLHCAASASRSNSSPMGMPQPARRTSCIQCAGSRCGQHSKDGWSPATAEKLDQTQRRVSSDWATPEKVCGLAARWVVRVSGGREACVAVKPAVFVGELCAGEMGSKG